MFKFIVLCALVAAASAISKDALLSLSGHRQSSSAASSDDVHAEVKSFSSDVRADGYEYAFDTTNGIAAAASGDDHGSAHGDFSWKSPEGVSVAIKYVADENGYQPSSDVLPTPHPIPAAILKSLEYIRSHPPHEDHHNGGKHF